MSSGMVNCQKCGELNQYARWVNGEFKNYDKLNCQKCGFEMHSKEKTYLEIQEEIKRGKSWLQRAIDWIT